MFEKYGDMMDRMIKQAMGSQLGMSSNHSTGQMPISTNTAGSSTSSVWSQSANISSGLSTTTSSLNENRKSM